MAKSKSSDGNKKKKGNILPFLVIVIIAFLAYKANPEYWQQGRLFEDLKNANKKEVKTEEVVQKPVEPAKPKEDPNAMYDGSIKGSKTIPLSVRRAVNTKDPTYYTYRSKKITFYLVYPEGPAGEQIVAQIRDSIIDKKLRDKFAVSALLYSQKDKKQQCELTWPQQFLCEQCDRKICAVNPKKSEFLVIPPTAQAAISKMNELNKSGDWGLDE